MHRCKSSIYLSYYIRALVKFRQSYVRITSVDDYEEGGKPSGGKQITFQCAKFSCGNNISVFERLGGTRDGGGKTWM